jgi:hypothetical protein
VKGNRQEKQKPANCGGLGFNNQFHSRRKDALRFWLFPEWTGLADFSKEPMPDTPPSPLSTPNTTLCDK